MDNFEKVACCFCGENLDYIDSVEINFGMISNPEETQTVFGHKKCLDNVLDKSVPRHPDLIEND